MNRTPKVLAVFFLSVSSSASGQNALNAQELFREVSASVVTVAGKNASGELMQGSGVVVAPHLIVSNCHVVGGSKQATVEHMGEAVQATVISFDTEHDLCLISAPQIEARPINLGSSTKVSIGEPVFAVGAPQGLNNTISEGIVSGLRSIDSAKLIQTTAAISHGSSGGGLFNQYGNLIGITTLYLADSQQLNFAVPAEWVSDLVANRNRSGRFASSPQTASAASHTSDSGDQAAADAAQAAADAAAAAADAAQAAADVAAADQARQKNLAPWVEVSSSDEIVVSFRKGSFDIGRNDGGETIAMAIAQFVDNKQGVSYRKLYVTATDCRLGYGDLVSLELDGAYITSTKIVSRGDSVASGVADMLCALYESTRK